MADEMPVKDVLCEAMEYLSKLGSNLRTRSENLKDKKIRRDKLNNALAVQKAADKVLLICELSKKSLANVEAGVRKVLEHIDVSQEASSPNGGKSSINTHSKRRDDKPKYHYFDYKSRKLKIKTKISLKHYTSVKVLARKMLTPMIDKYPVYYDCKLYRMRNRKGQAKNVAENSGKETESCIEECENVSVTVPFKHKESSAEKQDSSSLTLISEHRRRSNENTSRRSSKSDITKSPKNSRDAHMDSVDQKQTEKFEKYDEENSENEIKAIVKSNLQKPSTKISDEHETNKSQEPEPKRRKISESENKQQNNNDIITLDSDNENQNPSDFKNGKDESESDSEERAKNMNDSDSDTKKRAKNKNDSESDSHEKSENKNDNDSKKPIIKCVSLTKLLKPDVLKKDPIKSHKPKSSEKLSGKRFDVIKKNKMLETAKRNKDNFWTQKRKEVSAFKPKKFDINITRLPILNADFLIKNNISKIAKEGVIIYDITEDKPDSPVEEQTISNKEQTDKSKPNSKGTAFNDDSDDAQLIAEANKVKNSLLNESDSDQNENDTISMSKQKDSENSVNRIKNALLYSDSDQNEDSENCTTEPENTNEKENKNSWDKISESDDMNNKNKHNLGSDQRNAIVDSEAAKNDLLDKSDSDNISERSPKSPKKDKSHESEKSDKSCKEDSDNESEQSGKSHIKDSENERVKSDKSSKDHNEKDKNTPENISEALLKNQKTAEKEFGPGKDNNAKNSLLNDSSNDETEALIDQRKETTPKSNKKRIRESVHAKNALLRYSSGSETEDEQLRNTLNEIKKSLLEGMSDDENKIKAKNLGEQRRSSQGSSSSAEDILKIVKKKKSHDFHLSTSKIKHTKRKKQRIKSSSEEENKKSSSGDDEKSRSSSSKMVRSKVKPGNSSGHSSDAQDPNDKDIDGLTNLQTLNTSRRRISDATDQTESSNSRSTNRSRMAKQTGLIGEEILKAESSSDVASNDEDDAVDEDLPSVTLPGFNGGLEHLVKEDLLVDSDSSVSNKEEEASNKEDSDEERLKAKRRKANAIASSDSETGIARKKDKDTRNSDFDSDDSELTKRSKRKKKGTDSDASGGSSDAGKKKRRRIKSVNDSDASGSDSENEGKNKHGRKNIRKVMGKNQLEEATKKAAREEKERVARIAERQKMYNNLQFDESGKPDEVVLDRVELDFDPETKEPLIAVDRGLVKKLKPHQANGIKFMWDACFESVKRIKKAKGSGCILAHCMGLGKTLQVVALTHTLLAHDSLTKVHRVLVVCPLSTVLNWVNEFKMWLKHAEQNTDIDVYELSRFKQNGERAFQLSQWFEHGGVCVLGYEMFRNLSADNNKKFKKKMLKNFQEALVDPGPDLVVCDEGHLLKNEKTSLSQSMNKVRTLRRIVLTGTPLQNNLKEYYCMVQFVKPNLLGKYNEYLNRFVNPITNGQYTDSTDHDIKIMKRRSHVLHKMLDGAVQRRDYGVLAPFLPPKHEYVLFITLSAVQTKLYQFYLDNYSRRPLPGKSSGFLFPDFQSLQRIWTHPLVLKYNSERYEIMQQKKRDKEEEDSEGSLVDFIDDDSTPAESTSEDSSDDSSDLSDDSRKKSKKKKGKKSKGKDKEKEKDKESTAAARRRGTRANPIDLDLEEQKDDDILEVKNENPTEWWIKMVEDEELEDMRNSHKLVLLFDILRQCETIGDKLLVFSQSLYSLDLIEHFLGKVDEATQDGRIDEKLGGHVGSWSPGIDYFRLDGSTSCENRSIWCKNFNREDNPRARLFLISTRAGGLGINLVAANRVVIFDVSWNPSHDVQSIFRVYRFGQKKPCYVYRFLAMGTMEEKIYERQVTKQAISKRVIDEQQIDRHYAENDLAELYKFEAEPLSPRPLPPLPKDRLFAEMLREHEAQIYKYHEHDSLLENKEEETLSEEERKAAWEDFENEKSRPPPAPFPSPWPMNNGMMPNLLAQQQQQLAYAALAAMLRKDMPNVNDNQIRDMLPMIYNANPALMQKMSEIYKYTQQMNMNPSMMAQAGMNPASGGMAGMGSTSGLQYEPPWQRQQQQQQQMRLQQLMAQQQNMGAAAKFYAGGLGSRDPVAMALQQQRAREIMVGGGAGRPRGRPPLQPRAPPAPSADVVNLDSD